MEELSGASYQTISSAEFDKKSLRAENIIKVSQALGVSTDYLLTSNRNEHAYISLDGKLSAVVPEKYDRLMRIIDIILEE